MTLQSLARTIAKARPDGYYWIRAAEDGEWQVAQWVGDSFGEGSGAWWLTGWECPVRDDDVSEVDKLLAAPGDDK